MTKHEGDKLIEEREGFSIYLTESYLFRVPAIENHWPSKSLAEAREKIDKHVAAQAAQKRASTRVSLPVYDFSGCEDTLRGINANTSYVLCGKNADARGFYPRVEWIGPLLKERADLNKRIAELGRVLRKFEISHARGGYGRVGSAENLEKMVDDLVREHEQRTVEATERGTNLEKMVDDRARAAGAALEQAYPFGYRSEDKEP